MASHHTLLTIGAMALLSTVLLNFRGLVNDSSDDISRSEDMILAATVATSYLELAQAMAFDTSTDSSYITPTESAKLTLPQKLGPETADEDTIAEFNDIDDFNKYQVTKQVGTTRRHFTTKFEVNYVDPASVTTIASKQTFVKRLDAKTWRSFPPRPGGEAPDTLRMSLVLGYFRFN